MLLEHHAALGARIAATGAPFRTICPADRLRLKPAMVFNGVVLPQPGTHGDDELAGAMSDPRRRQGAGVAGAPS